MQTLSSASSSVVQAALSSSTRAFLAALWAATVAGLNSGAWRADATWRRVMYLVPSLLRLTTHSWELDEPVVALLLVVVVLCGEAWPLVELAAAASGVCWTRWPLRLLLAARCCSKSFCWSIIVCARFALFVYITSANYKYKRGVVNGVWAWLMECGRD